MDFAQYVKFATEYPYCSLATIDGDQPQVRTLQLWFADAKGFYFSTRKAKALYRQLSANPKVALSFYAPPESPPGEGDTMDIGTMMRAIGTAEFVGDPFMKERLMTDRPYLRQIAEDVVMFRVNSGEAWFWTFADNGRESMIERTRF